ncbi:MAG: antirestriction protein [Desulfuromonadaceae bacterium]
MSIQRKILNDSERIAYPAKIFGTHFPFRVEPFVYDMAGNLSRDYTGGYWKMFGLSNSGFYMAPDSDPPFHVSCMNGYEGALSADAFGLVVCLYAFSNLSFSEELTETCAEQFHLLREYMLEHSEVRSILAAID